MLFQLISGTKSVANNFDGTRDMFAVSFGKLKKYSRLCQKNFVRKWFGKDELGSSGRSL
jgi:hypothetical protein